MAKARDGGKIERLRALESGSPAQVDYALRLIETETHLETVQAALDVFAESTDPRVRPALLTRYAHCAENGTRRDPGCYLRALLLRALRQVVRRDDVALLEGAVLTTEFMPPGPIEVATGLRASALVTLNDIDETLAGYHAVRLLTDRHTSQMSGEPAVTAAQVLAVQGNVLPLYGYLLREQAVSVEVLAECLRGLVHTPVSLLGPLVERYRHSEDEIVLLGLFDLLLERNDRAAFADIMISFVRTTRSYNVYRYVVSAIVARRWTDLMAQLETIAAAEEDRLKAEILREALALR